MLKDEEEKRYVHELNIWVKKTLEFKGILF